MYTIETIMNAEKKTKTRRIGVAMKPARDMKWLECKQGAAKARPLKRSSLKIERNPMNCV